MAILPESVQNRIVNELYEAAAKSKKESRNYLGMSQIGHDCPRKLWYDFRKYTPVPLEGRIKMLFRFGDRIEEELIHHLSLAGYKVEGQQDAFSAHNGFFRGHCDGIIHGVTFRPHILECKSANAKKYAKFKKYGVRKVYPIYYCQCQCYMGYSGLERALVVVQCKDTSEIYTERLPFNSSDFNALHQRAYDIITANEPPDKIPESLTCEYCDQRINCKFPEEAIVTEHVCGTCYYMGFKGLTSTCRHPDHPYPILTWGIKCDDWLSATKKEPVLIKRLPIEEIPC
ncbi:MAG: YqaJ viral recombinase family protein [Proteobacteria bacterium]|nr:YqaJ viral recombinase family protein [Pseudomonadota bacterium]